MKLINANELKYGADGLIPAVVVDAETGKVLTVAYMNAESLEITMKEGRTCFWSRSRGELWRKENGESTWEYSPDEVTYGIGTWTLGGASAPASDATLSVTAGTLAFAAENAAAGVALSFAAGAALGVVAPEFSARGVVLTNGLSSAGVTLPVRIVASNSLPSDTFRLAVFTAPAATVDALLPALSGSATSGKSAAVSFSAGPAFDLGGVSVKTVSASVAPAAFVLIVR